MEYSITDEELETCSLAYVGWINPPHSVRVPTEEDRNRVRVIIMAFLKKRNQSDGVESHTTPCLDWPEPCRHAPPYHNDYRPRSLTTTEEQMLDVLTPPNEKVDE